MKNSHQHKRAHHNGVKKRKEAENGYMNTLKHLGISLLWGLGMGIGALFCFSLIAYFTPDPRFWLLPLGLAAAAISAFTVGFVLAKKEGHGALICGLISGGVLLGIFMICSLFMKKYAFGYTVLPSLLLHIFLPLLAVLGAYTGLRTPNKKRKRKHS